MTEGEWDAVIAVHMKGHFVPTRWAAAYWREQSKAGNQAPRAIVNTASGAMLGNMGQFNYAGAKAAIAAMTLVAAGELGRYGVRVNCLAPVARTRLTLATPGLEDIVKAPDDPSEFDLWDPANISPLVAYLSTADCPFTGGVFHVGGNEVGLYGGWSLADGDVIVTEGRWTVADLQAKAPKLTEGRGDLASVLTSIGDTMKDFGRRPLT
jgi:NAD(P)-dependent dehydrogenase (short-subunit alcohol dehydrogenase family)